MNILKAFKNNAIALAATAATLLMGVGASAQVKQDTIAKKTPIINNQGKQTGSEVKGRVYTPGTFQKYGSGTVERYSAKEFRNLNTKDEKGSSAQPKTTVKLGTWPAPTKEQNDEALKKLKAEFKAKGLNPKDIPDTVKVRSNRFLLSISKVETVPTATKESEKVKEIEVHTVDSVVYKIKQKTYTIVSVNPTPEDVKLDHGHLVVGGVFENQNSLKNINAGRTGNRREHGEFGVGISAQSPQFGPIIGKDKSPWNKLFGVKADLNVFPGVSDSTAVPKWTQGTESNTELFDAYTDKKPYINGSLMLQVGPKFHAADGAIEFKPSVNAGILFNSRTTYTMAPLIWDPTGTPNVMSPEQRHADPIIKPAFGVGFQFKANLGKKQTYIETADGKRYNEIEYQEAIQAEQLGMIDSLVTASAEADRIADSTAFAQDSVAFQQQLVEDSIALAKGETPKPRPAKPVDGNPPVQVRNLNMVSRLQQQAKRITKRGGPTISLDFMYNKNFGPTSNRAVNVGTNLNKNSINIGLRIGLNGWHTR